MNSRFGLVRILLAVGLGSLTTLAWAQEAGSPVPAKQYPWDHRQLSCLSADPEIANSQMCAFEHWPDSYTARERAYQLFVMPNWELVARAEKELGFSKGMFDDGKYHAEIWADALGRSYSQHAGTREEAERWVAALGGQGYGPLAVALSHVGDAKQARGGGAARTITPEGWKLIATSLETADRLLDECPAAVNGSIPWHDAKIDVTFLHPEWEDRRENVRRAAFAAWPAAGSLYMTPMIHALPMWGGSFEEVEVIAQLAVENSRKTHGTRHYAMLYELLLRLQSVFTINDTEVNWSLMKESFREIAAKGHDRWLFANMAKLACDKRDRAEAKFLFEVFEKDNPGVKLSEMRQKEPNACLEFALGDGA